VAEETVNRPTPTKLSLQQITGFWGAWAGWTLDGMDSVIYALVLSPALTELLPESGYKATPANVGFAGSILFALFLVGWGLSLVWGPIADRFGRSRVLAATIFVYAIFTGAAALSRTVWQLGLFRLLAGVGIGGEWALAGTYVAEAWPEDRRKMGAGYLQTGYYAGFFLASPPQLHGRSALWLAGHVLVRPDARRRCRHGSAPREGVGALATKVRGQSQSGRWTFFSAPDLQSPLHTAKRWSISSC
jgi:MFS family permease